jgi:hypothetical protein
MADPLRIALATCLAAASGIAALPAHAQVVSGLDLGAATRRDVAGSAPGYVVSQWLRAERSWWRAEATGSLWSGDAGPRAGGVLRASLDRPVLGALSAGVDGRLSRPTEGEPFDPAAALLAGRLSYRLGRSSGIWLGAERARLRADSVSPTSDGVRTGFWHQIGNFAVTFSIGAGASRAVSEGRTIRVPIVTFDTVGGVLQADTTWREDRDSTVTSLAQRWSNGEAAVTWMRGGMALNASFGARLATAGVPAARWAHVDATATLAPRVALFASAGSNPTPYALVAQPRRFLTAGFRLTPAPFKRPETLAPVRGAARSFAVEPAGQGKRRFVVRAPHARVVELTGDFTAWRPVALTRTDAETWEATLALAPGVHHVNIRVDGERWSAPPGMLTADDEFAGTVGLLVVEP